MILTTSLGGQHRRGLTDVIWRVGTGSSLASVLPPCTPRQADRRAGARIPYLLQPLSHPAVPAVRGYIPASVPGNDHCLARERHERRSGRPRSRARTSSSETDTASGPEPALRPFGKCSPWKTAGPSLPWLEHRQPNRVNYHQMPIIFDLPFSRFSGVLIPHTPYEGTENSLREVYSLIDFQINFRYFV